MFEQSNENAITDPGTDRLPLTAKAQEMTEDVLMSMHGILASHDIERCSSCFQRLCAAMDKIRVYPGNAEHYLREWAEKTRLLKHQNGCGSCHPPVFGDTGRDSSGTK